MYGQQLGAIGGNAAVAMTEPSRTPQIQAALEALHQVIEHLEDRAQQLTQRLAPIMMPQPPSTGAPKDAQPIPAYSHVAERIEVAATRLAALVQALDQTTRSLEI